VILDWLYFPVLVDSEFPRHLVMDHHQSPLPDEELQARVLFFQLLPRCSEFVLPGLLQQRPFRVDKHVLQFIDFHQLLFCKQNFDAVLLSHQLHLDDAVLLLVLFPESSYLALIDVTDLQSAKNLLDSLLQVLVFLLLFLRYPRDDDVVGNLILSESF